MRFVGRSFPPRAFAPEQAWSKAFVIEARPGVELTVAEITGALESDRGVDVRVKSFLLREVMDRMWR